MLRVVNPEAKREDQRDDSTGLGTGSDLGASWVSSNLPGPSLLKYNNYNAKTCAKCNLHVNNANILYITITMLQMVKNKTLLRLGLDKRISARTGNIQRD